LLAILQQIYLVGTKPPQNIMRPKILCAQVIMHLAVAAYRLG